MSINTQAFKTKTILQPRQHPSVKNYWGMAVDIGFSSVKVYSPNMLASFPSFAKAVEYGTADHPIGGLERTCIAYRDENRNEYFVGANAGDRITAGDADSSTATLYARNRYHSPEYKVITRVGLALGMMKNNFGDPSGKVLHIQTGLPPEYMSTDTEDIKSCFEGHHKFSIKLGASEWRDYEFDILSENIDVMPQPMGTLISIATDKNGGALPEASKYFSSNLLIFDPGFGTLDTFNIKNHYLDTSKTWGNLGMLRVMQETTKAIKDKYGQTIPVPAMQKLLGDGYFKTKFDHKTRSIKTIQFADILEEANKKVCMEALNTIDGFYDYMQEQDYLVVTGGTGAAWFDMVKQYYSGIETLKVISGAGNDTIPEIFSNVRGYYMNQLNILKRRNS